MPALHMAGLFDGRGFGGGRFVPGDRLVVFLPGLIGMLLVAALIGLAVWLVVRDRVPKSADPLRLAAGRYAAGKISKAEFERIRADLATAGPGRSTTTDRPADPSPAV